MATKKIGKTIAQQKAFDEETQVMMFEGISLSQAKQLFCMDINKIKAKIHGLAPVKTRAGHPIYSVKDMARYLVEPMWPIEEYIKHMNHADLPMLLRKEYWAGMRSRQLYEIAAGDLWPTEKVVEHLTEVLKTISISLRLMSDAVERETSLTPAQRDIIIRLMDDTLSNAHNSLAETLQSESQRGSTDGGSSTHSADDESEL